jgi:hypothetical protein
VAEQAAAGDERLDPRRRRRWLGIGVLSAMVLVGAGVAVAWWQRDAAFPVGSQRSVVLAVNECGAMEVEVDGATWSTGGTAGFEVANAFHEGPEPGVLVRTSAEAATFTSGLTAHSVELREHELHNLGCVVMLE